jgi:hypothetical protein
MPTGVNRAWDYEPLSGRYREEGEKVAKNKLEGHALSCSKTLADPDGTGIPSRAVQPTGGTSGAFQKL